MTRHVVIYVNGILTWPGDARDWNFRAVTWTHKYRSTHRARNFEYFCGPIGRAFGQHQRARHLAALIKQYQETNFLLTLVGHSNGCDVILDALKLSGWPPLEALHLVSGACEANFDANGLNSALHWGRIGTVRVYVAGRDKWLRLASRCFGRWLGYGTLGLHGPLNVSDRVENLVQTIHEPRYGHSTWWSRPAFDQTMGLLLPTLAT